MHHFVRTLSLCLLVVSSFANAVDVEGTWASNCFQMEQGYQKDTLTFAGNDVSWKMGIAQNKNCKAVMEVVLTMTYHIGPNAQSTPSANEFDMILSKATMTPRSGLVAGYLNSTKLCGFTDWKANVSKEVQGLTCGDKALPKTGDGIYDLIQVEGSKMLRGKATAELDGTSVEKRPLELDPNLEFSKQ